jgi:hypothetical protein
VARVHGNGNAAASTAARVHGSSRHVVDAVKPLTSVVIAATAATAAKKTCRQAGRQAGRHAGRQCRQAGSQRQAALTYAVQRHSPGALQRLHPRLDVLAVGATQHRDDLRGGVGGREACSPPRRQLASASEHDNVACSPSAKTYSSLVRTHTRPQPQHQAPCQGSAAHTAPGRQYTQHAASSTAAQQHSSTAAHTAAAP